MITDFAPPLITTTPYEDGPTREPSRLRRLRYSIFDFLRINGRLNRDLQILYLLLFSVLIIVPIVIFIAYLSTYGLVDFIKLFEKDNGSGLIIGAIGAFVYVTGSKLVIDLSAHNHLRRGAIEQVISDVSTLSTNMIEFNFIGFFQTIYNSPRIAVGTTSPNAEGKEDYFKVADSTLREISLVSSSRAIRTSTAFYGNLRASRDAYRILSQLMISTEPLSGMALSEREENVKRAAKVGFNLCLRALTSGVEFLNAARFSLPPETLSQQLSDPHSRTRETSSCIKTIIDHVNFNTRNIEAQIPDAPYIQLAVNPMLHEWLLSNNADSSGAHEMVVYFKIKVGMVEQSAGTSSPKPPE